MIDSTNTLRIWPEAAYTRDLCIFPVIPQSIGVMLCQTLSIPSKQAFDGDLMLHNRLLYRTTIHFKTQMNVAFYINLWRKSQWVWNSHLSSWETYSPWINCMQWIATNVDSHFAYNLTKKLTNVDLITVLIIGFVLFILKDIVDLQIRSFLACRQKRSWLLVKKSLLQW